MAEGFSRLTAVFALLEDLNAHNTGPASNWNNHKDVFEVDQHIATGRVDPTRPVIAGLDG